MYLFNPCSAKRNPQEHIFHSVSNAIFQKEVSKSRNRQLSELFLSGFGIHHAGMLRSDRNLTERLFSIGLIKVTLVMSSGYHGYFSDQKLCVHDIFAMCIGSCMYCNISMGSEFASTHCCYQGMII
mgnify:CR=1 FL=1